MPGLDRLRQFLASLESDIYPEPPSREALVCSQEALKALAERNLLWPGMRALDLGCGQGTAMMLFRERWIEMTGVTRGDDFNICRSHGFGFVVDADMHALPFGAAAFDLVWARHVLEHSPVPLYVLSEIRRLLKPGGILYAEVPYPDTECHHERNPNHYSVLGMSAWESLFGRQGFGIEHSMDFSLTVPAGKDAYRGWILRKGGASV